VLATLRERLKGNGIWVAGSRDYRAFEDYLLPAAAARDTGIDGETDPARYVAGRAVTLHERLAFVGAPGLGGLDRLTINDHQASTKPGLCLDHHRICDPRSA
jgi:hypothetical protein